MCFIPYGKLTPRVWKQRGKAEPFRVLTDLICVEIAPSFLHGFVTLFYKPCKKCYEAFLQEMHRQVLFGGIHW